MLLPETDTSVLPMVSCWWYLLQELSGWLKSTGRDQYQRVLLSTPQVQALQHLPGYSAGISVRQLRLHCTNTISESRNVLQKQVIYNLCDHNIVLLSQTESLDNSM